MDELVCSLVKYYSLEEVILLLAVSKDTPCLSGIGRSPLKVVLVAFEVLISCTEVSIEIVVDVSQEHLQSFNLLGVVMDLLLIFGLLLTVCVHGLSKGGLGAHLLKKVVVRQENGVFLVGVKQLGIFVGKLLNVVIAVLEVEVLKGDAT